MRRKEINQINEDPADIMFYMHIKVGVQKDILYQFASRDSIILTSYKSLPLEMRKL